MRTLLVVALVATALSGCLTDAAEDPDLVQSPVPTEAVHETATFADTVTIAAGTDGTSGCGSQGTVDAAETTWSILPPAGSSEGHVLDMVLTFSWGPSIVDADYVVYDPAGKEVARTTAFAAGASQETLAVDGKHATGDFRIVVLGCVGGGDVDIAGTATLGYVPA